MARVKRTYKDSLFCDIFSRKDYLQDVYRGLFGRDVSLQEIQLMTLQGTFFNDEKNDVSFLAGTRQIILMEHQSTLNENMPLRMFWYMAKLYRKQVPKDAPYRTRRLRLPAPCFYVFYNGLDPAPDEWEMRLSEAFEGECSSLELCVTAYNINEMSGSRLLEKSRALKGYSVFVAQIRRKTAAGVCLEGAVKQAIRYCIEQDLFILYPRMWTRRKKGWGKKQARQGSDENAFRDDESFFMDRFRCKKLPLHLTEKPISVDSSKKAESLERGQSKKVWNPCNRTLVQGSESFRMDKAAIVHAS